MALDVAQDTSKVVDNEIGNGAVNQAGVAHRRSNERVQVVERKDGSVELIIEKCSEIGKNDTVQSSSVGPLKTKL